MSKMIYCVMIYDSDNIFDGEDCISDQIVEVNKDLFYCGHKVYSQIFFSEKPNEADIIECVKSVRKELEKKNRCYYSLEYRIICYDLK